MAPTVNDLRNWLEQRYPEYEADGEARGTYGVIFLFRARHAGVYPRGFAAKTLDPERLADAERVKDLVYLRREFRMWLALPPSYNVVPALGIDLALLPSDGSDPVAALPVMRMPRLQSSLADWVGTSDPGTEDRLVALAQAFNGLLYLYEYGFEGHGDLKPANLLFRDLRDGYELPDRGPWPSKEHPWHVRVADLGWADAWVDLGFPSKAYRPYLAPERLGPDGRVVPQSSDVFSMGVIASELLQGRHPATNVNKIKQSDRNARRWAEQGDRVLDGLPSARLRGLVERCLRPDPAARPSPQECLSEICQELREAYSHDIEATLALWRRSVAGDATSEDEHVAWAAPQTLALGPDEARRAREDLERRIDQLGVRDLGSCERWADLAASLLDLLEHEGVDTAPKIGILRNQATEYLRSVLGPTDREALDTLPGRDGAPWNAFERLADVVGKIAKIAGTGTYDVTVAEQLGLGHLTSAAWAFASASSARSDSWDAATVDGFLAAAIQHAPDEATPYFFRAYWSKGRWLTSSILARQAHTRPRADELARWLEDVETAMALAPRWEEPRRLLESLRSQYR